ncbi:G patch domain-containing protein 11-like isoform X2 [Tachypleus tridentatus]|uniref:G patch domain-containing protein 11-like isoform X2 n=1 Tax=Tachypleus tridentatus TaxID=6853 RepID=UPI003FD33BEE
MPYQVATLIARAKLGATVEPSRTRILRRGGILIQPATSADQIYLCQPWNTEFKDIEVPHEPWFWPQSEMTDANLNESDDDDNAEKEEEEELDPSEKLEILTAYLRSTHFYCVWCGTAHEDDWGTISEVCYLK